VKIHFLTRTSLELAEAAEVNGSAPEINEFPKIPSKPIEKCIRCDIVVQHLNNSMPMIPIRERVSAAA
jgi:hypothetical protein